MTYTDSLWRNAPEGATHWAVLIERSEPTWIRFNETSKTYNFWQSESWGKIQWEADYVANDFIELHPCPLAYQSATQLIAEYRKEHGAKVESDCDGFLSFNPSLSIDHLIDNAAFHLSLLEKYLEIQRNKTE